MTLDVLLRTACNALRDAGIPFMLTGSVATAFHGASRSTMDIDFVRKDRGFSVTEFERRQSTEYLGMPLQVATIEDVMLSKLEWAKLGGSARQIEDVSALLRLNAGAFDLAYVTRWLDVLGVRALWDSALAWSRRA